MPKRKAIRGAGGGGKKPGSFTAAFVTALVVGGVITFVLLRAPQAPPAPQTSQAPELQPMPAKSEIARGERPDLPQKRPRNVVAPAPKSAPSGVGTTAIAIVIDDLGNDVPATRQAIALPCAVTLSFLPYPDATPELAREAVRSGHQILVHVPMEPEGSEYPGPMALRTDMATPEIVRRLDWDLSRVPGFSGINNHMGSRFTADAVALTPVMKELSRRHLFFFDSRTTAASQVVQLARRFGLASGARDVFLDDVNSADSITGQLDMLAHRAAQEGAAIAIGHPHAATLAAIEAWLNTRFAQKLALVPVSVAIALKSRRKPAATN